jgi:hypothetical protein
LGHIHFLLAKSANAEPACGDWSGTVNWTTAPGLVTCPKCIRRVRAQVSPLASRAVRPEPDAVGTPADAGAACE